MTDGIVISTSNLVKTYSISSSSKVEALRGIDLSIEEGSIVAITGKSGAGKSTLLHVLGLLERPTSGDVFLNNTNISGMPDSVASGFRNCTVGFVFQMNNLLPEFSALENVIMPGLIAGLSMSTLKERGRSLLSAVGLSNREDHRPGELSGGEQQRVAIARALVMSPPILLTDEPTGNLDQKTSFAVQDLLLELCEANNVTMLLVTHDKDLSRRLPYQIVMEDGLIVDSGRN